VASVQAYNATREQLASMIGEISTNAQTVSAASPSTQEIAAFAQELARTAEQLQLLVERFRVAA
jgi:methyl-accepting chemotaxis protein